MPFQKGNKIGKGRPKGARNKRPSVSYSKQMDDANAAYERLCQKAGLRADEGIPPAEEDTVQVACLKEVLNRAWGKPVEKKEITHKSHADKLRELEERVGFYVDDVRANAEPIELIEHQPATCETNGKAVL